jgi:hypothetical protein
MTLPISGQIALDQVSTELALPVRTAIGLGDSNVRDLCGINSGPVMASDLYGKTAVVAPSNIVYLGNSNIAAITEAGVLALPQVAVAALPYAFTLTSGPGQYQYWVSKKSFGPVKFYDAESMFIGGWDGAKNNMSLVGPKILLIGGIEHYVYRGDFPNLGLCYWEARVEATPYY